MKITVFVDKQVTKKQSDICKALGKKFVFMVDAVHGNDIDFLQINYGKQSRFFFVDEVVSRCLPSELGPIAPDFAIVFNEDQHISEKQWLYIERYIEKSFFPDVRVSERILHEVEQWIQPFIIPPLLQQPEDTSNPVQNNFYEMKTHLLEKQDILLVQVNKPFCDLPYTDVIHTYSQRGLLPFFTDLFICHSWGVSRNDIGFLHNVWTHYNMEGELDLQNRLIQATERCFPKEGQLPEAEPTVYRKSIEEVIDILTMKDEGKKRKAEYEKWNEERWEKRLRENDLL